MARDAQPRRTAHPENNALSSAPSEAAMSTDEPVVSLLARAVRPTDVLPHLHQHALDATGGTCSLLFEFDPGSGVMQATSGFGLEELATDPWRPEPPEHALVTDGFARRAPTLVADLARQMPDLHSRLGTPGALLLPLVRGSLRIGMLAIGFSGDPALGSGPDDVGTVADTFVTALELFRLRQKDELQVDLRSLLDEFSASLSTTLDLSAGLEIFCQGANRLFGADRTSVWVHDRRARALVLRASSDPEHVARGVNVSADDMLAPAAAAMRRTRAELLPVSGVVPTRTVTVPLRGCRRALGTIVFDGVRVETGGELDLLGRAEELGRQLSHTIENLQLLDDVMRSRRELEHTFDSIAHLIVVADRNGRIVHANHAFAARARQPREALLERQLAQCVGDELATWLAAHERSPLRPEGGTAESREIHDPVLDGRFMVTLTDFLDHNRERAGTVLVARDLTPQSKLEAEREALRTRLTQSEKLAALGQFVAGIAHELNNPLQGVLGHLELLRATHAFPKHLRRDVQTIYREADRAANIVRNLLVFAGSRRPARRAISLNAVLQKVLASRQRACRALEIELVRHYEQKLPRVLSDPLLLHQVFLNMIMNAEQAIAATGRPGRIEVTTATSGDMLVATVRDTGGGIAPDALTHVFEPFYTTKEVGRGTGLGLAIAYGIVQEHGGHISVANHRDGGAVFTVNLPAAPGSRDASDD
jgi:C4-dicarboxylate-specific signal transduction histidine kinase